MDELTLEIVLQYINSNGGRVQNNKLVTYFKDFLNHPVNKATNRQKFKDYINELATIKVIDGDKILILKGKYSQPATTPRQSSASVLQDDSRPAISQSSSGSQLDIDSPDGGMVSKARIDEMMEVNLLNSDRVPNSGKGDNVSISTTGSTASLVSNESQKSLASNTSFAASLEEDSNSSTISVQDKIKKLNKTISDTDLQKYRPPAINAGNKKVHKHAAGEDDSDTYATLDADQKDWLIVSASSDYHDMNKLLLKKPGLAKLKNLTNGYTALHWAAKSGKSEVIKMIASKPGVNVNHRSGFTALHLAAIHGHEEVMELLVKIYKADVNLRDYSGKKAKQYLRSCTSMKTQQLFVSRRLGSEEILSRSSMRKSGRGKGVSSLLQAMSSVARQPLLNLSVPFEGCDEKDGHLKTPPDSRESSPATGRRNPISDMNFVPPQSETGTITPKNSSTGSKSSSRDTSPSLRGNND